MAANKKVLDEFTIEYRPQREWRWLITAAFFLGGIGAGLFLICLFLDFRLGLVVGFLVVTVGKGTAHLLYLGRPLRFWRAFARPSSSWISRGMIGIAVFSVFAFLYLLPKYVGLPWGEGTGAGIFIKVMAGLGAFMVMIYTGFVMAYSPSIPFWNTSLLPVLFVLYGFMGGMGTLFLIIPFAGEVGFDIKLLESMEILLLMTAMIIIATYLGTMYYATVAAKKAVQMLTRGSVAGYFLPLVVVVGMVVPLAIALFFAGGAGVAASGYLALAAILELIGAFTLRYALLRVGYRNPVL